MEQVSVDPRNHPGYTMMQKALSMLFNAHTWHCILFVFFSMRGTNPVPEGDTRLLTSI